MVRIVILSEAKDQCKRGLQLHRSFASLRMTEIFGMTEQIFRMTRRIVMTLSMGCALEMVSQFGETADYE